MSLTLEERMRVPAYFHLLSDDELATVIEDARTVIFDDVSDRETKMAAGARLFYARADETKRANYALDRGTPDAYGRYSK